MKKILFVIGAGASKEVKMPTGSELTRIIGQHLDYRFDDWRRMSGGDLDIHNAFIILEQQEHPQGRGNIGAYIQAARRIRDAMPQAISIDNFIESHQGDKYLELCGKLAIVKAILEAERTSFLYLSPQETHDTAYFLRLENTWYKLLMQIITENATISQLEERLSNITFIVFNYDRCLEKFIYHAIQNYYGIDVDNAARIVKGIKIYHPFGTVGRLTYNKTGRSIDYGKVPNSHQLVELIRQIKTFTEGTDPESSDIVNIRKGMYEANIIIFLGFAYHRLNLRLLEPPDNSHNDITDIEYYGTAKNISISDCDVIKKDLSKIGGVKEEKISIRYDFTCNDLFREYWRRFSSVIN